MNYLLIFILKLLENTLSTLRIILLTNNKKIYSSILLFLISIVWITTSGFAIINFDLITIIVFSLGSFLGSILGNFIEENFSFGNELIICINNKSLEDNLRKDGYIITKILSYKKQEILFIIIKRNKKKELIKKIRKYDNKSIVISENTNIY